MEQKGLDINFFIGMFLIFGLLMWFNMNQVPIEKKELINTNDTLVVDDNTQFNQDSQIGSNVNDDSSFLASQDVQTYSLSNNNLDILFSNKGASIQEVVLKNLV